MMTVLGEMLDAEIRAVRAENEGDMEAEDVAMADFDMHRSALREIIAAQVCNR